MCQLNRSKQHFPIGCTASGYLSRRANMYIKLSVVRKLVCPWNATFELKNEVRRYSTSGLTANAGEIRI
jgi:hypothetical protein